MLKHQFRTKAHNLVSLFEEANKLSQFMEKLNEQSTLDPDRYDPDKYKGDGFEFFIELLLYLHPCDSRVGIGNYRPIKKNDNGVDGVGINLRSEKCAVQIKYRSNTNSTLTANKDHLGNFFTTAQLSFGVVADEEDKKNYRHFIFTTAKGLNYYTKDNMFKGRVRCFGYNDVRQLVDGNTLFWNSARNIVAIINERQKVKDTESIKRLPEKSSIRSQ